LLENCIKISLRKVKIYLISANITKNIFEAYQMRKQFYYVILTDFTADDDKLIRSVKKTFDILVD